MKTDHDENTEYLFKNTIIGTFHWESSISKMFQRSDKRYMEADFNRYVTKIWPKVWSSNQRSL